MEAPDLPSSEELLCPRPNLPRVDEHAGDSKLAYLVAQHSVLRYEGTEPLRRAVNEYRRKPMMFESESTSVYTKVYVQGYLLSRVGAACRISFDTDRSTTKVHWETTHRLATGTIVALSPASDNFKTKCFVATVACRVINGGLMPNQDEDPATPPRIYILWATEGEAVMDPTLELVMIESRDGFYEAVRHGMTGLRDATLENCVLDRYILGKQTTDTVPAYIQNFANDGKKLKSRIGGCDVDCAPRDTHATVVGNGSTFDHSQVDAIERILSSEVSIIQGPPGTGKTFTSVSALKLLTDNFPVSKGSASGPIIVAAQSNFAIDQLLRRCHAEGIKFARVGARCRDDVIKEHTMYAIRKEHDIGNSARWRVSKELKKLGREAKALISMVFTNLLHPDEFVKADLISEEQRESLGDPAGIGRRTQPKDHPFACDNDPKGEMATWLKDDLIPPPTFTYTTPSRQVEAPVQDSDVLEDRAGDQEEELLKGEFIAMTLRWTGYLDPQHLRNWHRKAAVEIKNNADLYTINPTIRGCVFKYLQEHLLEKRMAELRELLRLYNKCCQEMNEDKFTADAALIKRENIQIIGCTTTGLGKYRKFLAMCNPQVMLIEEAAETWEANITSALLPSLQQLILVGDHVQLSPRCDMKELNGSPYHFNRSLFERLVNGGVPLTTLSCQRRMIPELRENFDMWYNKLTDHSSVSGFDPVPGMAKNSWWFKHSFVDETSTLGSRFNYNEARMIVGLYKHLLRNRVPPSKITVLTFYRGQQATLLDMLRRDSDVKSHTAGFSINVRTVDGYQGEENDVIILSLVRSKRWNRDSHVGFLGESNRMVVSLSRARRGLYVFGDDSNLLADTKASTVWGEPISRFRGRLCLDEHLPLMCSKHDYVTKIHEPKDWDLTDGGCQKPCLGQACDAGHVCGRKCHPGSCADIRCMEPCKKKLRCGHQCENRCSDDCSCEMGARCQNRIRHHDHGFVSMTQTWKENETKRNAYADKVVAEDAIVVLPTSNRVPGLIHHFRQRQLQPLVPGVPDSAAQPAAKSPATCSFGETDDLIDVEDRNTGQLEKTDDGMVDEEQPPADSEAVGIHILDLDQPAPTLVSAPESVSVDLLDLDTEPSAEGFGRGDLLEFDMEPETSSWPVNILDFGTEQAPADSMTVDIFYSEGGNAFEQEAGDVEQKADDMEQERVHVELGLDHLGEMSVYDGTGWEEASTWSAVSSHADPSRASVPSASVDGAMALEDDDLISF